MTPQKSQNHLFPLSTHEKTSSPPKFFFQDQAKRANLRLPSSRGCNLGCTTKASVKKLSRPSPEAGRAQSLLRIPAIAAVSMFYYCSSVSASTKKPQAEELNEAKSRLALRESASVQIQDFVAG